MTKVARSILVAFLFVGGIAAHRAEQAPEPVPYAPRDPVVADVLRMSGAGVSENAIVEWLQKTRPAVAPLSPDDLIGLSRAKVPQRVVSELIALGGAPPPAPAAPAGAPAVAPTAVPAPPAAAPVADPAAPVPVRWTVSYRAASEVDEDPPDLALYLDGRLLVRIPGRRANDRRATVTFARPLPPGTTLIWAFRERPREDDGVWTFDTRVAAGPIAIEVPPGPQLAVKVEYAEDWLGLPRPSLAWSVERDGTVLSSREKQGGNPERWAWLCEDTEASVGPKGPNSVQRYHLKGCVRWASLWGDAPGVPARDVLLREFEAQGFGEFVPN